jgi:hypothetical protein
MRTTTAKEEGYKTKGFEEWYVSFSINHQGRVPFPRESFRAGWAACKKILGSELNTKRKGIINDLILRNERLTSKKIFWESRCEELIAQNKRLLERIREEKS